MQICTPSSTQERPGLLSLRMKQPRENCHSLKHRFCRFDPFRAIRPKERRDFARRSLDERYIPACIPKSSGRLVSISVNPKSTQRIEPKLLDTGFSPPITSGGCAKSLDPWRTAECTLRHEFRWDANTPKKRIDARRREKAARIRRLTPRRKPWKRCYRWPVRQSCNLRLEPSRQPQRV